MEADGVQPADLSSDAEWLRRVYLDLTGRIPQPEDTMYIADFQVNTNGDIVFTGYDSAENAIVFQRAGGTQQMIYSYIDLQPGDPLLFNTLDLDIRDDRTVYLLTQNENDQKVFYVAKPLN